MTFHPNDFGIFQMRLSGLVEDEFTLDKTKLEGDSGTGVAHKTYQFEVKPGREAIHIHCTPPPRYYYPEDNRNACYHVNDFKIEELR
jgi:hypothetical protein